MAIPSDLPRLIHEALTQLGAHDADPEAIAKLVRQLDYGLPAEDEFSVLCAWLGQCELVHKLDQQQTPPASRDAFQVPDLLAKFAGSAAVLIEVKVSNKQTLSFKPDYYRRITAYAAMMNLPLLIAWKFHSVWMLFEMRHAKLARVNYNIRFDLAMKQNLLGVLAGDVAYVAQPGAGLHITLAKDALVESRTEGSTTTETWQMHISGFEFTKAGGEPAKLHAETGQILTTFDLEEEEDHGPDQVRQSFVAIEGSGMQLAHRGLVRLLDWESGSRERASWRSLLGEAKIVRSIADFRAALDRALKEGVIRYIFHQQPGDMPSFLSKSD